VEAVGTVRYRDCISLADANYGARSDFGVRQFFPTKLCIAFGSAADFSGRPTYLHGTFVYRIQRNVAHRGRQPAAECNSQCN
jgi:hypothetical protein